MKTIEVTVSRLLLVVVLMAAACASDPADEIHDDDGHGDDGVDAAPSGPCAPSYAGCATYEDLTAAAAVDVTISASAPYKYQPRCIKVRAGTPVTIAASGLHPLQAAACNAEDPFGLGFAAATTTTTVTPAAPGVIGYFCRAHGTSAGTGQAAAIQVVP